MILISMLLVLVGAVTLGVGALLRDDLTLVWVSIGACILAAVFLVLGVVRSRPKPTASSPGGATWSGASSTSRRSEATEPAGTSEVDRSRDDPPVEVEILTAEEAAEGTEVQTTGEVPSDKPSVEAGAGEEAPSEEAGGGEPREGGAVADTAPRPPAEEARFAALTDVSGVGPTRASELREHFSSYAALRRASLEELMEVDGISEVLATRIREHLAADD